ncbi:MAG TPA: polyprenyl synthetase family protein [bacterium]|nr:polyprenyl synthetase family protein [bacterium]
MVFTSVQDRIRNFDDRILNALVTVDTGIVEVLKPFLLNQGKRIRPILVYLINGALGCSVTERTHRFATIVEMIHTASLFHDDVLDDAGIRRGKPSANRLFGNNLSILAGDLLYIRALAMMNTESRELRNAVHDVVTAMTEAELNQGFKRYTLRDVSESININRGKTANLIALACLLGAAETGNPEKMEASRQFGESLGMAFQIIDDLLDWFGTPSMGKQRFQDLRRGHITLPLLILLEELPPDERRALTRSITRADIARDTATATGCVELMERYGIRDMVLNRAGEWIGSARMFLDTLPLTPFRHDLEILVEKVIERTR